MVETDRFRGARRECAVTVIWSTDRLPRHEVSSGLGEIYGWGKDRVLCTMHNNNGPEAEMRSI